MTAQIERVRFAAGDFIDPDFDGEAFRRAWPGSAYHDTATDELVLLYCPAVFEDRRAALAAQLAAKGAAGAVIDAIQSLEAKE